MQNILNKSDRPADAGGRADEGSQTNLLPLAKKWKTALNPKSDAEHSECGTTMRRERRVNTQSLTIKHMPHSVERILLIVNNTYRTCH